MRDSHQHRQRTNEGTGTQVCASAGSYTAVDVPEQETATDVGNTEDRVGQPTHRDRTVENHQRTVKINWCLQ